MLKTLSGSEHEEEYFNYAFELGRSFGENKLPQYIVDEVQKIKSADLIIFQVGEWSFLLIEYHLQWIQFTPY